MSFSFIQPTWNAPKNIKALTTLRVGGTSELPYKSLNLATHVGDNELQVHANRARLKSFLELPYEPLWLTQVHGTHVIDAHTAQPNIIADGSFSYQKGLACAVLTADCVPILLTDYKGDIVSALHAGWRGILNGIIEAGVKAVNTNSSQLIAWMGPAIGACHFEVGSEVFDEFVAAYPDSKMAFKPSANNKFFGDLFLICRQILRSLGLTNISGGEWCTASRLDLFYSYRMEGTTGRMATLIWKI